MLKSQVQVSLEKGTKALRLRAFPDHFTGIITKYVQIAKIYQLNE